MNFLNEAQATNCDRQPCKNITTQQKGHLMYLFGAFEPTIVESGHSARIPPADQILRTKTLYFEKLKSDS